MLPTRIAGIEMTWPAALINVRDQHNVTITGKGTIDVMAPSGGNRIGTFAPYMSPKGLRWASDYDARRPRLILIQNSSDVLLGGGILLKRSGFLDRQILYSHDVHLDGVTIRNNEGGRGPSTDGIDIDSSRKVLVEHADIDVNDDALCLKAGRDPTACASTGLPRIFVVRRLDRAPRSCGHHHRQRNLRGLPQHRGLQHYRAQRRALRVLFKSAHTRGGYAKDIRHPRPHAGRRRHTHSHHHELESELQLRYPARRRKRHSTVLDRSDNHRSRAARPAALQRRSHLEYQATGARSAFNVSAYPNATLDDFRFDHLESRPPRRAPSPTPGIWTSPTATSRQPMEASRLHGFNDERPEGHTVWGTK